MPLYEFCCSKCGNQFEQIVFASDKEPIECPRCGATKPERLLSELERLRDRHGLRFMMWMGGEPMLRWRTVEKGLPIFPRNHITTNGTVPLKRVSG